MPVQLIKPRRFGDARGWFTEVYSVPAFAKLGITCTFVQDNHSLSVPAYTLRGLHFQTPPRGQDKLVRCVRGRMRSPRSSESSTTGSSRRTCRMTSRRRAEVGSRDGAGTTLSRRGKPAPVGGGQP